MKHGTRKLDIKEESGALLVLLRDIITILCRHLHAEALCRGAGVVLAAPEGVPRKGNDDEANKHNGSVVDAGGGDREVSRHAEQRDGEDRPGWRLR